MIYEGNLIMRGSKLWEIFKVVYSILSLKVDIIPFNFCLIFFKKNQVMKSKLIKMFLRNKDFISKLIQIVVIKILDFRLITAKF